MSDSRECPSVEQLRELAVGRLPDPPAGELEEHLLACEACAQQTAELQPSDTLVSAMREAKRTLAERSLEEQSWLDRLKTTLSGLRSSEIEATVVSNPQQTYAAERGLAEEVALELMAAWNTAQKPDELGRLGNYRILKLLGAGGMGAVFLAEDIQLQRRVALKVMRPHAMATHGAVERFLREARAAASVKHEHVVTIYQVGEAIVERPSGTMSIPFLAQELLEGESLEDRLRRESPLPINEAVRIGREIAEGLAAAHAKGLIHRDIKPANVWLERSPVAPRQDSRGETDAATSLDVIGDIDVASTSGFPVAERQGYVRVKLLDFGLARSTAAESQITSSGMIVGTPSYMAPEQANGETVDARADLFSLGVVLYRMTTGRLPFPGNAVMEILKALATVTPAAPQSLNPELPREFSDLIERLLAKEAAQRPETAAVVAKALSDILIEPSSPKLAVGGQRADPPKRTAWTFWGAAAFLLLLGVIVIKITDKNGTTTTLRVSEGTDTTLNTATGSKIEITQNPAANSATPKPETTSDPDRRVDAPADAAAKNFAVHLHPKQAIVVEGILGLKSDDPLTLELWVQPDAAAFESSKWIMAQVSMMYLEKRRQGDRELLVSSLLEDAPGGVSKPTRGFAWAKGQRMHVAAISEHKRTSFHVDGKLIGIAEVNAPRPSTPVKTLRIGMESSDFSGIVDEVRLSRGVRYTKDFPPPARFEPDEDTLVLLHCDEGEGEWMRDASGRGNDGRISQAPKLPVRWVRADGSPIPAAETKR